MDQPLVKTSVVTPEVFSVTIAVSAGTIAVGTVIAAASGWRKGVEGGTIEGGAMIVVGSGWRKGVEGGLIWGGTIGGAFTLNTVPSFKQTSLTLHGPTGIC